MVMSVVTAMAMAMDGLSAMQWRRMDCWQHNSDGRLEDGATAMRQQWSNATEMNGAMVMEIVMGSSNGRLVGR
jgi:hypothetical protein